MGLLVFLNFFQKKWIFLFKINIFILLDYFNMLVLKIIIKYYFNIFLNKKYFKK